jgi:ketosteroid isomerase-like protein
METKERIVRDFYAARARRDWDDVRELLAEHVAWHEGGSQDYSGDHHGRNNVAELIAKFIEVTGGTFALEPQEMISTAEHVAAAVRWRAERNGVSVDGNDLAVYRVADGQIAEAWFFADGYDPQALGQVFSFAESE